MAKFDWLGSSGEMAALIRAKDWSKTPLGPTENWSATLLMSIKSLLANRFPVLLCWGPEYVQFYNDAYIPIPGAKHPRALGECGRDCWQEIWPVLQPLVDTPFQGGPATWLEDLQLEIRRSNFTEETHFTVAYSPVSDDASAGGIGGVLATVHEITGTIVSARRVTMLRDLSARAMEAKTPEQSCVVAATILEENPKDIPFALLYLVDPGATSARLEGVAGVEAGQNISPRLIKLSETHGKTFCWPLAEALRSEKMVVVENIDKIFKKIPQGPWSDAPNKAAVLPIRSNKAHEFLGVLVAGISARLALDDQYASFLELAATQIATVVGNSRAFEDERKKAAALAEIDRDKTSFFSNVSHEFRTPLTLMLGPIDDLLSREQTSLPPAAKTQLELASRNGNRLLRLVNNLLDFSRMEAGRLQAIYEPMDLGTFTADLASVFRSATEKAGLRLKLKCPALDEPVFVDRTMWEKIVLNLMSNAFKFTFEGEISVELKRAGGNIELRVRDTGVGIPEEEIPRLFERFHRIENSRSRTQEGSGIGLALVQELVKVHGGSVRAESILGAGSTFIVTMPIGDGHLPKGRVHSKQTEAAANTDGGAAYVEEVIRWLPDSEISETPEENQAQRERKSEGILQKSTQEAEADRRPLVFVADDNADMRQYIAKLLSETYEVKVFRHGQAALDAIRKKLPDLILSDVMMPTLDGFGLLRELRADPATQAIPVILLSARAGEDAIVDGIDRGADDYLIKPFTSRELLARVKAQLHMSFVRKQSAETLRLRKEQFETLLNNAPLGVHVVDSHFRIREANSIARDAFGNIPDLIGRKIDEVISSFWSRESTEELVENYRHTMETGEPYRIYEQSRSRLGRDGKEFYEWQINRTVLPEGGYGVVCYFRDITSAIVGRESIAQSEQRLRLATEAAELGIWLWNIDSDQVVWENERPYEIFGRTHEDGPINGAEFKKICHPDDVNAFDRAVAHTLQSGARFLVQVRIYCKDGTIRWVEFNGNLQSTTRESSLSILGTVLDITARKQSQEVLRESEERLRLAMDAANMGSWDWNMVTGVNLWNPRHEMLWGYEPGRPSRTYAEFENRLHPDDVERVRLAISECQEKHTEHISEYRVVWPDGSVHWICALGRFHYDSEGRAIRMVGMLEDVTQRRQSEEALRQSEERLRFALEASQMGLWHWNLGTGEVRWDLRHEVLYGYEPGTPSRTYAEFADRVHPEDLESLTAAISDCRNRRVDLLHEFRIVWPDGSVHWIRALGRFLYDDKENPTQMLGTSEDITARKLAEEAVRASENKLRMAHKAAHSGAWEWRLDSGQAFWSPELEELYGIPEGTFAGKMDAWKKMVVPEDIERIERELPIIFEKATDLRLQFRIARPDSQIRWIEAVGQVLRNGQGKALVVTGISKDITERKAGEEKLRLTTERFELALRNSSIAVFNHDLDLRYTWIYNPALGYQPWEIIGKRDSDIFERLEDAEISEAIKVDVIRTGVSRHQEIVIRDKNVDRHYDLQVDPLKDSNGKITGITCAAIDITERRQGQEALQRSEYRFRTLIDSNIIPILSLNRDLVTEANDVFLQMVGYTRDELKAGKINWVKMTPPEHFEKDLRAIDQLKNCLFTAPYEKEYIRKDGSRVSVLIGMVILGHSPEEYLCFIVDLSEQKRVEADLRGVQQELEQKVSERTLELTLSLAAVGSEIRGRKETEEQLRELSGRLLRLQDEEHRRIARELHDSTGQTLSALKMSLSVLEQHVKNIPRGQAVLEDLNMLVDTAIQEVRTTSHLLHPPMLDEIGFSSAARWYLEGFAQRSGILTAIDFADLPDLSKDEELALFRVLQESLTNVHRHSGSKSAEVRIYSEGDSVILSIRDFGKGIPLEKLEKFNKTGAGVGVGLGGMKQRLHELDGNLEVRSEEKGVTILAKLRKSKRARKSYFEAESAEPAD